MLFFNLPDAKFPRFVRISERPFTIRPDRIGSSRGTADGKTGPPPHLENRISVQKCQEKTPPETHPPAPRGIEKSPCHSGTGALVAGVNGKASNSSLYFAGTQAAGAGVDTAGSTIYNCLYTSDIGLPGTVRTAMRVRNLDPESNALTTNFAFCHLSAPPYGAIIIMQH